MAKWKWEKVDKLTGTETFLKNVPGFYGKRDSRCRYPVCTVGAGETVRIVWYQT